MKSPRHKSGAWRFRVTGTDGSVTEYERPSASVREGKGEIEYYVSGKRGQPASSDAAHIEMLALEYSKWNAMLNGWPRLGVVKHKGVVAPEPACCQCAERPSHPRSYFCSAGCAHEWADEYATRLPKLDLEPCSALHGSEPSTCARCAGAKALSSCFACAVAVQTEASFFCSARCAVGWAETAVVALRSRVLLVYCEDHDEWLCGEKQCRACEEDEL